MASSSGMKASSSRSIKTCSNEFCGKSMDVSRPGWKSNGRKVDLCNQCFVAFRRNQFCSVYHKTLKGWKTCRSCQKDFHCGCLASSTLYDEINSEIECRGCVAHHANLNQKSDSKETNDDAIITQTPRADGGATIIPTPNDNTTITTTPCVNDTMIGPIPHANDTTITPTPRAIDDTTITPTHRAIDDTTITQTPRIIDETTIIPTPCANDDTTITTTPCVNDDTVITPTARANPTATITPAPLANHDTTTLTVTPHALEHNASETSSKTRASAQTRGEKRQTGRRREKSVPYHCIPRMTNLQVEEIKRGCAGENSRIVIDLGEEEIPDGPQGLEVKLIPLFEKVLTAADTGKSKWLVLPKNCAQKFFPSIDDQVSKQIVCQDTEGEDWRFKFRSWPKNKGRMYVLDEFYLYVQAMELSLGDTVTFSRLDPERKLVIGYRKNSSESPSNHLPRAAIASTSSVRNTRGIVKLNNVNGEKGKYKLAMPSMVSQGELNAFPRVESDLAAPRVPVFVIKKSVEVGSTRNSSRKKQKLSEVETPSEAQEPVSSDHGGNGPFLEVANGVKIKSKKDPKPKLAIGHQNATLASSFSQLAQGIVKLNESAAKAKNKLAKVSKVTKGKPDASASSQLDIPAINVPFSAKRKHFEVGSTSQGKKQKQKRKLSEVDLTSDEVQEPVPSPSYSNGTIELVANGVKIKSTKKLERMVREILYKQELATGNQNATSPSLASQDKAETSTRKKQSKGKNSLPTLANISKGKAIDSTSAPPNMVPAELPVRAKGKHIEIGSTSRSANRKRKISAFDPTLKESTEVEWSPRPPRSSKGKAAVRSSTPPPKRAPSKDKSVAKKMKNITLRTIGESSSKKNKTRNLEPEPQGKVEARAAREPSNVTKRHPRHRTGCKCIICIQPPSGSKHSSTCPCPSCVVKRLRLKNMKEKASQKPPIRRRRKVPEPAEPSNQQIARVSRGSEENQVERREPSPSPSAEPSNQQTITVRSGSEENQNDGRELSQSAEPSNQKTISVSSGLEENQNERIIEPPQSAEHPNVPTITVNRDSEENQNEQSLTGSHSNNTIRPLFDLNLPASDDDEDFVDPSRQYTNGYGGYISE